MNPVWTILFAPLAATVIITVFTQRWKMLSALVSVAAILLSFAFTLGLFWAMYSLSKQPDHEVLSVPGPSIHWLVIGEVVRIDFGAIVDRLSILMLLVVTG